MLPKAHGRSYEIQQGVAERSLHCLGWTVQGGLQSPTGSIDSVLTVLREVMQSTVQRMYRARH